MAAAKGDKQGGNIIRLYHVFYSSLQCKAGVYFGRANALAAILHFKSRGGLLRVESVTKGVGIRLKEKGRGGGGKRKRKMRLPTVIVCLGYSVRGQTEPLTGAVWRLKNDACQSTVNG